MKISLVADIHHGPLSKNFADIRDPEWPLVAELTRFVDRAIRERSDILVDLGDRITDSNHENDVKYCNEVAKILQRFTGERVHLAGNHDIINLSIEENEAILESSLQSRSVDLGDFRLIAWQPSVAFDYVKGRFPPIGEQLGWLIQTLLADDRPAVIATHVSLAGREQTGNYYHHHAQSYSTYPDHAEVRRAVEETGRVAVWLAGHSHWNTLTNIANVQHITIQSFNERFTTYPVTSNSFVDIEIDKDLFILDVLGNDPFRICLPFRKSGEQKWISPIIRRPVTADQ